MKLVLQHFPGCPNGPVLLERVREAIEFSNLEIEFEEITVDDSELAKQHSFRGSPTLLVDGEDFAGKPAPEHPTLTCRIYPGGLPTVEDILWKLEEAGR